METMSRYSEENFEKICESLEAGEIVTLPSGTDPYSQIAAYDYFSKLQEKYKKNLVHRKHPEIPLMLQVRLLR